MQVVKALTATDFILLILLAWVAVFIAPKWVVPYYCFPSIQIINTSRDSHFLGKSSIGSGSKAISMPSVPLNHGSGWRLHNELMDLGMKVLDMPSNSSLPSYIVVSASYILGYVPISLITFSPYIDFLYCRKDLIGFLIADWTCKEAAKPCSWKN
jgi:hypothetical protein